MVTVEQVEQLPLFHRAVISAAMLDTMGHMNVRHYAAIFDDAAWKFFESLGMTLAYNQANNAGGFALKQFITYLAEVRLGETVAVRCCMLGRSAKRMHMMYFMVNETRGILAATLEGLGAHADMQIRRTAPFPPHIAHNIDALIAQQNALGWDLPVCGVIAP